MARAKKAWRHLVRVHSLMMNNTVMGIAVVRHRVFEKVNPRFASILGLPLHRIQGADVRIVYASEEDYRCYGRQIYTALSEGIWFEHTLRTRRLDGKTIVCRVIGKAFDPADVQEGSLWILEDVTEACRAEEDLRQAHRHLDEVIEHLPDATFVINAQGVVMAWNQAMEEMTGIPKAAMLGKGNYEYALPFYGERRPILIDLVLTSGPMTEAKYVRTERKEMILDGEAFVVTPQGDERYLYGRASALKDAQGNRVGAIESIRDMTKQKRLEQQLRQAQKMEAIGTLAGGIAHDFNNILASLIGFTEMAVKEPREDVRRKYLDRVLEACGRAKNLTTQILSFSRKQEQAFKPFDVRFILKEAVSLMRATLPSTIEIRQIITQEDTKVLADPTQIHQIVINLCTNAAQAMREKGGILDIRLSNVEIFHPDLAPHPDLPLGFYVVLSVGDTGCGIDPAIKDKIFDPFFTTKGPGEGTGLGLSVVYGIVKQCGGAVDVRSAVGHGSVFSVYLPRVHAEMEAEKPRQDDIEPGGNERILFVDDEESLVALAKAFFESRGYRIAATMSSLEALKWFQDDPHRFDLVITDMTMPEMTGAELARTCLNIRGDIPIILCTGYSESINAAQAREWKIREFVLKPIELNDLARLVRRVLGHKT